MPYTLVVTHMPEFIEILTYGTSNYVPALVDLITQPQIRSGIF